MNSKYVQFFMHLGIDQQIINWTGNMLEGRLINFRGNVERQNNKFPGKCDFAFM